ncbi:hypothetical protein P3S68_007439 [Capsicum galapagoense]
MLPVMLHQVINNSPRYCVCVTYFYEPNFDAAIEPLDMCLQKTGGTKNFEGAVYGKHLKIFKKPKKIFAYTFEHNVL